MDDQQQRTQYNWPKYTADDRQVLVLDTSGHQTQTGLRDRYCQFWSEFVPQLRTATGRPSYTVQYTLQRRNLGGKEGPDPHCLERGDGHPHFLRPLGSKILQVQNTMSTRGL